jgi:hypothetical protein
MNWNPNAETQPLNNTAHRPHWWAHAENIEHLTSNTEHQNGSNPRFATIKHWMFDVECSMFSHRALSTTPTCHEHILPTYRISRLGTAALSLAGRGCRRGAACVSWAGPAQCSAGALRRGGRGIGAHGGIRGGDGVVALAGGEWG